MEAKKDKAEEIRSKTEEFAAAMNRLVESDNLGMVMAVTYTDGKGGFDTLTATVGKGPLCAVSKELLDEDSTIRRIMDQWHGLQDYLTGKHDAHGC